MQSITANELKELMDRNEDTPVINVLPEDQFRDAHIPGSTNVPLATDGFAAEVERRAGSKDKRVVVYCASTECDASPKAAAKLESAGFRHVADFEGGVKAWRAKGYPLEGAAARG